MFAAIGAGVRGQVITYVIDEERFEVIHKVAVALDAPVLFVEGNGLLPGLDQYRGGGQV